MLIQYLAMLEAEQDGGLMRLASDTLLATIEYVAHCVRVYGVVDCPSGDGDSPLFKSCPGLFRGEQLLWGFSGHGVGPFFSVLVDAIWRGLALFMFVTLVEYFH